MSDQAPARTEARTRRSRWPGWIWAVPLAALLIVGWLLFRAIAEGGASVKVSFGQTPGVRATDTKVVYRGVEVGEVSGIALAKDDSKVVLTLKMDRDATPLLRSGARFWLIGAHPDLNHLAELKDAITGPQIGLDPGSGASARTFQGLDEAPQDAPIGPQVAYRVDFDGPVGELQSGAPVELRGFKVGEVTGVDLRYDAAAGQLESAATLTLQPERIGLTQPAGGDWRALTDGAMDRLVRAGLRADLSQSPPLIGPRLVTLDFTGPANGPGLGAEGDARVIPAGSEADLAGIERQASEVMGKTSGILDKIDAVPIEQIGENLRASTDRLRQILKSPHIDHTLANVDDASADLDKTIRSVSPQIDPLVRKLRQTADDADQTVDQVHKLVGGDPTSQDSDVPSALHQITDAARALRVLADELQRHPESLVSGKPKDKP